jgi:hypothetical protein
MKTLLHLLAALLLGTTFGIGCGAGNPAPPAEGKATVENPSTMLPTSALPGDPSKPPQGGVPTVGATPGATTTPPAP